MKNFTSFVLCTFLLFSAHNLKSQCSSPVALPYFNGFEGDSAEGMPQCLTIQNTTYFSFGVKVINGGWQGNRQLLLSEGYAGEGHDGWVFFPAMNFESGKTYSVSFQYRGFHNYPVNSSPFSVHYGTSANAAAMVNLLGSTKYWPDAFTPFNKNFTPVTGTYYVGIHFRNTPDNGNSLSIDNFKVSETIPPACPCVITGYNIKTDVVNLNKAIITWRKPLQATLSDLYEWELRTTADPGSGNAGLFNSGNTTDTTLMLTGLNPDVRYYLYVRTMCNGTSPVNWSLLRLKTKSPEYASMALPFAITKYNSNPNANGPISIPDFPAAGFNAWYKFVANGENLILQIRKEITSRGGYLTAENLHINYEIYLSTPDSLPGNLVYIGDTWLYTWIRYQFCYNGNCQPGNAVAGDCPMPVLNEGQQYFIRFKTNDVVENLTRVVISFEAGIYNKDIWFGDAAIDKATSEVPLGVNGGNKWIGFYSDDQKMYASVYPSANNFGIVRAEAFRNTGTMSKDVFGTIILDRNFRFRSTIQPTGSFKIRLYFTQSELKRFTDSTGKGLAHLRVTQNNNDSLFNPFPAYSNDNYFTGGKQIIPDTGTYDVYKYLEFETAQLGTFYIHGDSVRLPVISQHPFNKIVCPGTIVSLSSNAINGLPAPLIQWQQSTNGGITWTNIVNAKNATYTFTQTENRDGVMYRAAWSNTAGTIYSNPAIVRNVLVAALSAPCCAGGNVIATSNSGVSQITWLYNNSPVSTQNFNYPANAITVAGGNGSGSAANQFTNPFSVATDTAGNVYVADAGNHRIQIFAPGNATGTTVAGGNGAGVSSNQLNNPRSVFVDATGNLYVADAGNNRIQKWLANALSGTTIAGGNGAGSAANQLSSPRSIYVDCNNAVYIADQSNNRIQKWLPGATTGTTIAGGNADGSNANQLSSPAAVFEDGKGNLLVADRLNQRIQQFSLPKTATYTINEGGAYKAIVTGTGCCSVNTQQVIINAANGPVICPGSSTYFVSQNSASGNTWQWQVNSGNGFVNIMDNATYSGTTSDTIRLNVPSTALYGYKYRSVINSTVFSPEYVLKFAVNWTGNNSTGWENAANWSCGVLPDENTDVIIKAGLANYPLVNANSVCGSLKLMPGTAVTVKTGIKLDVKRK